MKISDFFTETDKNIFKAYNEAIKILGKKHDHWNTFSALAGYMLRKKYGVQSSEYVTISNINGYNKELESLFETFDQKFIDDESFSLLDD